MTVDALMPERSMEVERGEATGSRFLGRMRSATTSIEQGTRAALGSYEGKLVLSSSTLFGVQAAIAMGMSRGMSGNIWEQIGAVVGGTAFLKGAEFVRDTYLKDAAAQTHQ